MNSILYKFLFLLIFATFSNAYLFAQNERFHGGAGDGAASVSSSLNFNDVDYVGNDLTVQIDRAIGQDDVTDVTPINFSVVFSEPVLEFVPDDVLLSGTALATTVQISGSGTNYTVTVSGMWGNGTVIIDVPAGNVRNSVGNPNQTPSYIDNEVSFFGADLNVEITRAAGQAYITNSSTVHFSVNFSNVVSDFTNTDVQYSGVANPTSVAVSGSGRLYDVAVSGMQNDGSITINIPANIAQDSYGKSNNSSINTENTVIYDISRPNVEINLANGQTDPAYELPLKFDVIFSEDVTNFSEESISYGGSAGLALVVSGSGSNYNVIIDGALTNETVTISIPEGVAYDFIGNPNTSSDNVHNSITFLGITGINNIAKSGIAKVYYTNGNIIISFYELPKENVLVEIYNLQGQHILDKKISDKLNYLPLKPSNTYIIRLSGKNLNYFTKIFAQ